MGLNELLWVLVVKEGIRGAHGPVWSDLTLKSNQTKNFGLEIFQTKPDRLNHQTGPNQTVLQGSGLRFFIFIFSPKLIYVSIQIFLHIQSPNIKICN